MARFAAIWFALLIAWPAHCSAESPPKLSGRFTDISYNPADGYLYAIRVNETIQPYSLTFTIARIDPRTAQVVNSVDSPAGLADLTVASTGGRLFVRHYQNNNDIARYTLPNLVPDGEVTIPDAVCGFAVSPFEANTFATALCYGDTVLFRDGAMLPSRVPYVPGVGGLIFNSASQLIGFGDDTLETMFVDSYGLHASSTLYRWNIGSTTVLVGRRIFTDRGLVLSADTLRPLGRFILTEDGASGSAFAVAVDSPKAYYLFTDPYAFKTKIGAYSIDSFQLAGTYSIDAAVERMALCGSVLAVADSEAITFIPVSAFTSFPTEAPSPQQLNTDGVMLLSLPSLPTNSMALDSRRGFLYATTSDSAGAFGNTLVAIDSATLAIKGTLAVGSQPARLAQTDSGKYLHVSVLGTASVTTVDLDSFQIQTTTLLSALSGPPPKPPGSPGRRNGRTPSPPDLLPANDIAAARGSDEVFVVCGENGTTVAYAQSAPITHEISNGCTTVLPGDRPGSVIISGQNFEGHFSGNFLERLQLGRMGVVVAEAQENTPAGMRPALVTPDSFYTIDGEVRQFANPQRQGLLPEYDSIALSPDGSRIFTVRSEYPTTLVLTAFNRNTLVAESTYTFKIANLNQFYSGVPIEIAVGNDSAYIRYWGGICLVPLRLFSAIPETRVTPVTLGGGNTAVAGTIQQFAVLPNSHTLVFTLGGTADPGTGRLGFWNTDTNDIRYSGFIGGIPRAVGITNDGAEVWVEQYARQAVRRYSLPDIKPIGDVLYDASFQSIVGTIAAVPGSPRAMSIRVVNDHYDPPPGYVGIFDGSVRRPATVGQYVKGGFNDSGDRFYGFNVYTSEFGFYRYSIDSQGFHQLSDTPSLGDGFGLDSKFSNGLVYTCYGRVIDPGSSRVVRQYDVRGADSGFGTNATLVLPDASRAVVYFLGLGTRGLKLLAFDQTSGGLAGSLAVLPDNTFPLQVATLDTSRIAFLASDGVLGVIDVSSIAVLPRP